MYKVGDKVIIVKKSEFNVSWTTDMDKTIGKYGVITSIYKYTNASNFVYVVKLEPYYSSSYWSYDKESLENERELKLKKILNGKR